MAQVTIKVRLPVWRIKAAILATKMLAFKEKLFPGSVDVDAATDTLTAFIVRGLKIGA